jgi:exosortase A-associated hydrolase 1
MRRMIDFDCSGDLLVGSIDEGDGSTGLLIVSGGNEIRSGAHAGQAAMAQHFAANGNPVFRYDRRGIGDSEGVNGGFESSANDIAAAVLAFRCAAPHITRLVAFGNCDAASALALFHADVPIDALVLANPWVIEGTSGEDAPTPPSAAAVRARYWARLKNPRSLLDLLTGKISFTKLAGGLAKAARKEPTSGLARRLASVFSATDRRVRILIAHQDTTALAFMGAWKGDAFAEARNAGNIILASFGTASHSFADALSKEWLYEQVADVLMEHKSDSGI